MLKLTLVFLLLLSIFMIVFAVGFLVYKYLESSESKDASNTTTPSSSSSSQTENKEETSTQESNKQQDQEGIVSKESYDNLKTQLNTSKLKEHSMAQEITTLNSVVENYKKAIENNKKTKGLEEIKRRRNLFLNDALADEVSGKHESKSKSLPLKYKEPSAVNKNLVKKKLCVEYGSDSVYEVFSLLSDLNNKVAVNTVANKYFLGGSFTYEARRRNGYISQEECFMALFYGHMTSLLDNVKDENDTYIKNEDGRYKYKDDVFEDNILFSEYCHPRISADVLSRYNEGNRGRQYFTDFIFQLYEEIKINIELNKDRVVNIYSISAVDRRNKSSLESDQIKSDTEAKISKMLIHAANNECNSVVITIPGCGSFSNKSTKTREKDTDYVNSIQEGTVAAIMKYGVYFDKIVLCGHTNKSASIFNNSKKE